MLTHIHIRDFAIIDELSLELHDGMTALTGETGAGKSILVDALGLVLGDRADSGVVRHGAERAEISVHLDLSAEPEARDWLAEQGLDHEECILRRVIQADGKSRAWINGSPATLQNLKALGEKLVDIHGQNAHQSSMHRSVQRSLLDQSGEHGPLLERVAHCFAQWQEKKARLDTLLADHQALSARRELLQFQVDELGRLQPNVDEWPLLEQEQGRLAHAERLLATARAAHEGLYEQDLSVDSVLARFIAELEQVIDLDSSLNEPMELLSAAHIQIREAATLLRRYGETLDLDPERLKQVDARMAEWLGLAKKHQVSAEQLPDLHQQLDQELQSLEKDMDDLGGLSAGVDSALKAYLQAAQDLSNMRQKTAASLSHAITEAMLQLGMGGGCFACAVHWDDQARPSAQGMDKIEFQVSANPGQPLQPLSKVASGGELSRISLAIQMIAAHALPIASLIFDEVDVGIGGAVAEVVGQQLRQLAQHRQVLCVTHLPQVAAQAHHHLCVHKQKASDSTRTDIATLANEQRIQELARMLGGVEITPQSLAHAKDMLKRASSR